MGTVKQPNGHRVFEPDQAGKLRERIERRAKTKALRRAMARRRVEDLFEERRLAHDLFDVFATEGGQGTAQ